MTKAIMGRPPKLTLEERAEVLSAFESYIKINPDPTIVGFTASDPVALKYFVNKDNIHDWDDFSELRRRAIEKQEHYLLYGATRGQLNASVSIFRLKQPQHGYKDRVDSDITSNGETIAPLIVSPIKKRDASAQAETSENTGVS